MDHGVSYIIAVYNGQTYLAEAIDSILHQTVAPRELIVVNDGSTDGTADVCRQYGDRIRHVYQDNAGHSAARNHGVELARGEFVAFLDADDLIKPNKLERQLAQFDQRPELAFCHAFSENFWSPDIPEDQRTNTPMHQKTHPLAPISDHISTWLARRELFETLGGFKTGMTFGEDTDWFNRVGKSGAQVLQMKEVLAQRRLHAENLTLCNYADHVAHMYKQFKQMKEEMDRAG